LFYGHIVKRLRPLIVLGIIHDLLYGWPKCAAVISSNRVTWYKINFTTEYSLSSWSINEIY